MREGFTDEYFEQIVKYAKEHKSSTLSNLGVTDLRQCFNEEYYDQLYNYDPNFRAKLQKLERKRTSKRYKSEWCGYHHHICVYMFVIIKND